MRCLCIYNPASAAGAVGRQWPRFESRLTAAGITCQVLPFTGGDLAGDLERALAAGPCHTVIGIGGDGTHNAALNALLAVAVRRGEAPPPYLPLPFGTGNDIAKSLGIPDPRRHLARVIELLRRDRTVAFDLGRWGDLYIADALCLGFDAAILARRDRYLQRLANHPRLLRLGGGYLLYTLATLALLPRPPRWRGRIELDGHLFYEGSLCNLVINNTAIHAGEFMVTPGARHDDGLLNVGIFATPGECLSAYLRGWRHAPAAWRRPLAERPGQGRARRLTITLDRPAPVQVDGEAHGLTDRLTLELHPAAARLRIP